MTAIMPDLSVIADARDKFLEVGFGDDRPQSHSSENFRIPLIRLLSFDADERVFTLTYDDFTRAKFSVNELDGIDGRKVVYWVIDEVRAGVEVVLDDGTITSFSGDFARYQSDPEYRKWADAQRDKDSQRNFSSVIATRVRALR